MPDLIDTAVPNGIAADYVLFDCWFANNRKRRGRSGYLLSVEVMVGKENPIPAKIVYVMNKANRKDWLAFI